MSEVTVDHSSRKHAKLSASGSATWLNCSASVRMQEKYPNETSSFAQEGTCAHEVADLCLRNNHDAKHYLGQTIEDVKVDSDMVHYVQEYLDYIHSLKGDLYPEQRVCFDNYVPDGFGTSDAIVFDTENKIVHICDLKYGKGIEVSAVGNTQGRLYALGVFQEYEDFYDMETFHIHIIQPRLNNYSEDVVTLEELMSFGDYVKERAELALSPKSGFNPSPKACQWCKAKHELTDGKGNVIQHGCKAHADYTFNEIAESFDECFGETEELTDEQIDIILERSSMLEKFVKQVRADVQMRIEQGGSFKGYKIVEGRSSRKWIPRAEKILVDELGEMAFNKKLIGLGEAEKLIGKAQVDELTERQKGKPQLVKDSNPKPAMTFETDEDMFGDI